MRFNNLPSMFAELCAQKYASKEVNNFFDSIENYAVIYTEPEIHEIVRLYNIHCMPPKYQVKAPTPSAPSNKKASK